MAATSMESSADTIEIGEIPSVHPPSVPLPLNFLIVPDYGESFKFPNALTDMPHKRVEDPRIPVSSGQQPTSSRQQTTDDMRFSFLFGTFPQSSCLVLFCHFLYFSCFLCFPAPSSSSASVDVRCSHGKCHLKDNNGGRRCRSTKFPSPERREKFCLFSFPSVFVFFGRI